MKRQLIEFSAVRFGVNAKAFDDGSVALVPASAIGAGGQLDPSGLRRVMPELITYKPDDLLQEGDVLLIGKGNVNHAAVWPGSDEDTVASGTLYVIRPDAQQVLPHFLAGYLNSAQVRAWFAGHQKMGTVKVLGRAALNLLLVPVPSLHEQQRFVHFMHATHQAQVLLNDLAQAHTNMLNSVWAQFDRT